MARTIEEKRRDADRQAGIGARRIWRGSHKVVDTPPQDEIGSISAPLVAPPVPPEPARRQTMTLTFKNLSENGKQAIYSGAARSIRFIVDGFVGDTAPETIEVADGVFKQPKQPKVKLTKEERAALRASQPKPTEAERIAKAEAKLAARKAKLAAAEASL